MYKKINFTAPDPSKKNILMVCGQLDSREYTYGYVAPLIEVLKESFNVFILSDTGKAIKKYKLQNVYCFNLNYWKSTIISKLKRKSDTDNYQEINSKIITEEIEKCFKNEPNFDSIIIQDNHNLMLPYGAYTTTPGLKESLNDYFEFPNPTDEQREEIEKLNNKLFKNVFNAFRPLVFIYRYKGIMLRTVQLLQAKTDCRVEVIVIDATAGIPFFKVNNIKHKFWYYTDDMRDGREFHRFPFPELQHLVYEKEFSEIVAKSLLDTEDISFFFSGTLFNLKGTRKYIWKEFFKDFKYEGAELYFKDKVRSLPENEARQMKEEVYSHPNYKGEFMENKVFVNKLKNSKTSFIARSVQYRDGLTYRHIQLLDFGILPIFDYKYDPDRIWIPEKFQSKLTVKNAEELIKVVDYYCNNEEERKTLVNEMREYYQIEEWKSNWENMLKETNLIKEIHEATRH